MRGLSPAPISPPDPAGCPSSAHQAETETAEDAGERFGVVVTRHDGAAGDLPRIDDRQQKELPMPQRDDLGVELMPTGHIVGWVSDDSRRF